MARIVDVEGRFETGPYIARQSWISAFSEPTPAPPTPSELTSKFQQRMVDGDLSSSVPYRLAQEASNIDAVLVDLVDERYGVVPTAEGYVTNSYDLRNAKWKEQLAVGEVLALGTPKHFDQWTVAADKMIALFQELDLTHRVYLVDTKYAKLTSRGEDFEGRALTPSVRDAQFAPYYEYLRKSPLSRIEMPDEFAVADGEHMWGVEPFHYIQEYYKFMADELEKCISASRTPRAE